MGLWTKERIQNILDEKTFDEQVSEEGLSQKQKLEIRENIWYKLYLLQNYKVSMNMFIGSTMRWKTIQLYQSFIRSIYKGKVDEYTTSAVYSPSLIKYIKGLMNTGMEPYPTLDENITSVEQLLNEGLLNTNELRFIYSHVGVMDNEPDTSISGCRNTSGHISHGEREEHETYSKLVLFEDDKYKYTFNPFKNIKNSRVKVPSNVETKIKISDIFRNPFKLSQISRI